MNDPSETIDSVPEGRLQRVRTEYEAAWRKALKGTPPPDLEQFVVLAAEKDRPALRQQLVDVAQLYKDRLDQTWQLVRAEERSYHTSDPEKMKTRVLTPPKDYGKVDIADFDQEHYKRPAGRKGRK